MTTMAFTERSLLLITAMIIAAIMASIAEAKGPAPPSPRTTTTAPPLPTSNTTASAPPVACTNAFVALLPCAHYIMGSNGNATPACCNAFVAVIVNNAASCLCQFLGTQNPLGFPVNQTQALALPAACNVTTPSLATQCSAIGVPLTPTSGLPVSPKSPGSSPAAIAPAPSALPSPGPSTTAETPTTTPAPPPVGFPTLIPSSGNNSSSSSSSVSLGSSHPRTNSGVSVSAVFGVWTFSLTMGVILQGRF